VEHLAQRRIEAFRERMAGRSIDLEQALDVLWEEHQGPIFDASLELWVAARTDPELRPNLVQMERGVAAALAQEFVAALGPAAEREGFTEDMIFALSQVRGLALLRNSTGVSAAVLAQRWTEARERLVRVLS